MGAGSAKCGPPSPLVTANDTALMTGDKIPTDRASDYQRRGKSPIFARIALPEWINARTMDGHVRRDKRWDDHRQS